MCECGKVLDLCAADLIRDERWPPLHVLHMSVGTRHSRLTCSSPANESAHQSHLVAGFVVIKLIKRMQKE